jgi:hypothetical protein
LSQAACSVMSMDDQVLDTCHPDEIVDAIGQLHGLHNAAHCQLMKMCVAYDARELWRQDGANSMAEWLCMRLAWSPKTARELVEVAHALKDLPAIAAAYEAGTLSFDQLRAVVKIATPETDESWATKGREMSLAQLEAWARRAREIRRPRRPTTTAAGASGGAGTSTSRGSRSGDGCRPIRGRW